MPPTARSTGGKPAREHHDGSEQKDAVVDAPEASEGERTPAQKAAEKRKVQPKAVAGPGSGNRLLIVDEDGHEREVGGIDDLTSADPQSIMVVLARDVIEEVPAPGAPNRTVKQLRYRKGRVIPKAVLDRHVRSTMAASDDKGEE